MDLDKLAGTQALQEADQARPDELLLSGLAWQLPYIEFSVSPELAVDCSSTV